MGEKRKDSNVEALLTAILTHDDKYVIVPESRVEALLLAIFEAGGAGGGSGVDGYAREELLKKVEKKDGYALIAISEIERLANVTNYDDTAIKKTIDSKVSSVEGYSLIKTTDYNEFKKLKNYDDTGIKAALDSKISNTVTIGNLKVADSITLTQLNALLSLGETGIYVIKENGKVLSSNDFTDAMKQEITNISTYITNNKTLISSINEKYTKPSTGIPKTDLSESVQTSLGKADSALQEETYKGTYSKPSTGIPKTDLSESVQTSLGKADSALQEETYKGTYSKPSTGIPKTDLSESVQTSLGKADSALQAHQSLADYVKTTDSRLSDSRNAKDVYDWAKQQNKPSYTKTEVGLGNVDNKSSETIRGEITSSNVTTALGYTPINSNLKGVVNGIAELDANGKIPSSQLPSYVDDVITKDTISKFPTTGEDGKIYIASDTNKTYRWSGSGYVEISQSLALGETSSTAYRGDRGKEAYDHAKSAHAPTTNATQSTAGLMSADDKKKLDGIASNANNYSLPIASNTTLGGVKIGSNLTMGTDGTLNAIDTNTWRPLGTGANEAAAGNDSRFMTSAERTKLSGIATGATAVSESTVSGWGFTKNGGTVTKVKVGTSEYSPSSGVVSLPAYVTKTSVSSANKTTSTIAITDNSQMAMVAKISGKTVKSPNLFNKNNVVKNKGYNGSGVEGDTKDWNDHSEFIPVKPNTKYYIANVQGSNVYYAANEFNASKTWIRLNPISGNSDASGVITTSSTTAYIVVNVAPSMASKTIVAESASAVPYMPYGLVSSPVESVVSVGKNLFNPNQLTINGGFRAATGELDANNEIVCGYMEIPKGITTITVSGDKAWTGVYGHVFFDANKSFISTFGTPTTTAKSLDVPSNAKYIGVSIYKNVTYKTMQIEEGTAATAYVPFNKTTVLVPQSIRNLPDYGVENNIVDFENGTYTHNNTISNGAVTAYTGTDKVIPISDYLRPLPVENGGTITLVNEHNLDMPSVIKYKKEV